MLGGIIFAAILLLGCVVGGIILLAVVYQTINASKQYNKTIDNRKNSYEANH